MAEIQEDDNRRADLEAAIKEHDKEPEPVQSEPSGDTPPTDASLPSTPDAATPVNAEKTGEVKPVEEKPVEAAKEPAQPKPKKGPTAPIDWTPDERAQFGQLPEWAQKRIHDREVAVNKTLQETVEARRISEQLVRTIEPYRAIMQAEGATNPLQAIEALLQTAATLQVGTPVQKAQRLAQLATHYGIDIELLDKSLAGTMPANPEQDRIERMIQERMAPVNQLLNQFQNAQQYQQQQVEQVAVQTVETMAMQPEKYPHLEAVRFEMANRLDLAAQNNQPLTLDEAYEASCWTVPTIRQQMISQQFNGAAQTNQQHIQAKRDAASSITGTRGGSNGAANMGDMSLRDQIAAQFPAGGRI